MCFAEATRWMLSDAYPRSTPALVSESTGCGMAALLSFVLTRRAPFGRQHEGRFALAGAMLLCGPVIGLLLAGRGLEPNSLTIALTLVPVVAALADTALGGTSPGSFAGRTWPGLAAVGGLLLLLPQPSLADPKTDAALLLAPLLTGIGAAMLCSVSDTSLAASTQSRLTAALSGAALLFGVALGVQVVVHRAALQFSLPAALLDGALAALAVVALTRIGSTRWSARFTLVPLAVVVQGLILLRPRIDLRTGSALALLTLACVFLLLPQVDQLDADEST